MEHERDPVVKLTLQQWNTLLGVLRTGSGLGITWEITHPLINAIGTQLQQQISAKVVPMEPPAA